MFDLGWTELLVIGIVALIVVGPKDLPGMFRAVGNFVGKAKRMARDFSQAMNDAADDAGVGDVKKSFDAASNPMKSASDAIRDQAKSMTDFDPESETGKLSAERAEAAKKIREASAAKAEARIAKEKKAAEEAAAAAEAAEAGETSKDADAEKDDKA